MAADWVEVFRTHDQLEAEFFKGLLQTSDIPVIMEARGLKALPGIFGHAALGLLVLKVPPDLTALAAELLEAQVQEEEAPGNDNQ